MSIRTTSLVTGEFYHIYNRGNSKQIIFNDEQDYKYFMNLLVIMNSEKRSKSRYIKQELKSEERIISIGAFCLMPNHFHILIRQEKENGITIFMQKVSTAYVMYYNKKYDRSGALFEGKFKSKYAGEDRYLKYLFAYIHLNPLKIRDPDWKTNIKIGKNIDGDYNFIINYNYSSVGEYLNYKYEIIDKSAFPDYFPTKEDFKRELLSWIYLDN